jgi:hypothetical protein
VSNLCSALLGEPRSLINACWHDAFQLTNEQIQAVQLAGARKRFASLRPGLAVLDKLATVQGIDKIAVLDDIAPLLFAHTVYKSYAMTNLERCRFDRLTRWLDGLTTIDLSEVDSSGIKTIDDWIDHLDRTTTLRVFHTSGTTGKLGFIPRTEQEWRDNMKLMANIVRDHFGPRSGADLLAEHRPVISPTYRYGASAAQRGMELNAEMIGGGGENVLFMYQDARFSADLASLAGRLRAAEARGEQGAVEISPELRRRGQELTRLAAERPQQLRRFIDIAAKKFGKQDVFIGAVWSILWDWAKPGLAGGTKNVFGAGSVLFTGGGTKGKVMPDNFREQCLEFIGIDRCYEMYAMSEMMSCCMRCHRGNYHIPPVIVPFVFDPATGQPLPRRDPQVGRFAALDLLPDTYWAGLVTGDEVTVAGWSEPCGCGRLGPYLLPEIRRYGVSEGGDDRIICAGAPEAHDEAMEFLAELSQ